MSAESQRHILWRPVHLSWITGRVRSKLATILASGGRLQHKHQFDLLGGDGNLRALAATRSRRLAQHQQSSLRQRPDVAANVGAVALHPVGQRLNRREIAALPDGLEQLVSTRSKHGKQSADGLEAHGRYREGSQTLEFARRPSLDPLEEGFFGLDAYLENPSPFGSATPSRGCLRGLRFFSHGSRRILFGAQEDSHGA